MRKIKSINISRYTALIILLFIIFAAILFRLIDLQVINQEEYARRAANASTRLIATQAPRGKITDSNGIVLADSKNSYSVVYLEAEDSSEELYSTLRELFSLFKELDIAIEDGFELKIDPQGSFYMDYGTEDEATIKAMDLRWKQDRNLDYSLGQELEGFKDLDKDNEEELNIYEETILSVTPEEMFYRLVKEYSMYNLLNPTEEEAKAYSSMSGEEIARALQESYSLEEIRSFMVVLDKIKMSSYSSFSTITIASNISVENANILMQKENVLSGINIEIEPVRYYPYGSLGSTVLGYMSYISSNNQEKYQELGYDVSSDKIGVSGIEGAFEKYLVGSKRETIVSVDTYGNIKEELESNEAVPGNNLKLTIDSSLQYTAERALEETLQELQRNRLTAGSITSNATRGAVVVQEVNTGKVLAMASYPYFDPNNISEDILAPDYEAFAEEYIKSTGTSLTPEDLFSEDYTRDNYDIYPKALYNYATQGSVPTGSTYKFVTAMAALEEGVVDPKEQILDQGVFNKYKEVENYTGMCGIYETYGTTHGHEDMTQAFKDSCNYYFYELAYRLYKNSGIDTLPEYAWKLGLGYNPETNERSSTGIEIEETTSGQVYSSNAYTNLVATLSKYDIVDMLEAGEYTYAPSLGEKHRGFNIGVSSNDHEELAKAKQAVKDYVSEALKKLWEVENINDFYDEVYTEAINLLKNLVETYEEEERVKYTEADFENAAKNIARYVAFDRSGDVTSVGNLLNSSIGLGMNNLTPLQLCSALSTVLNGGTRYKSYLVNEITDLDGNVIEEYNPVILNELNLKEGTVEAIKEGMAAVTASNSTFANFPISTGGKTGTAIYSNNQKDIGRSSYAVFEAFAPYDNPEIAITVVLYDGGGGSNAAPVARAIFETYFRDELTESYPNYKSSTTDYSLKPEIDNID
ncbi:penicillin-binding transpeptidase domain-containing protein [Alloiococcus sp. CFN-8]|uniref:penicillin-binding transpeptidase domain-containing protein n=1 Tax=Alloiococcus sp. CFN-8 TaxID=3416081 RepID=UPI003CF0278B